MIVSNFGAIKPLEYGVTIGFRKYGILPGVTNVCGPFGHFSWPLQIHIAKQPTTLGGSSHGS